MKQNSGFTIVELMISIVVLGVLLSIAAPGFQAIVSDARQVTFFNKLSSTLRYARSEAIKRSTAVTICPKATDTSCGTDWANGMLVFLDSASNGTALSYDGSDSTLRAVNLPSSGIQMTSLAVLGNTTTPVATNTIRFNGRGQPNWVNGTIVVCDKRGAAHAKALIMTGSGVGRKAYSSTSSNGVVVDARGNAVTCT